MTLRIIRPEGARRTILLASWAAAFAVIMPSAPVHASPTRKFALLVGHNDGGPGTTRLRYAESDTEKLHSVLRELGGYREEDVVRILGGTAEAVMLGLSDLEAKIRAARSDDGAHTTLLVYYSGHGKEGSLRLGATRLPMAALRQLLQGSSADMKLGIIDACESGAITREKGGRRGPSFLLDSDDRDAGHGLILITSSADSESSQESDDLAGSFFTHYLTSGLRGDADESGDRRVSLGEVYAYTYHKTVNITAHTRAGTQHPTYSYDFKGNGDIILTDLSRGASGVSFDASIRGDFLIFDMKLERVAAEIKKVAGAPRSIALPPGDYVLKKRLPDHLRMRRFSLSANTYVSVDESAMERVEFENDYAKGISVESTLEGEPARASLKLLFMYQSFFSQRARAELFPPTALVGIGVDLAPLLGARLTTDLMIGGRNGVALDLRGIAIDYDFFEAAVAAALLYEIDLGAFEIRGGPRIAGVYVKRSFPGDELLRRHPQDHFTVSPGLAFAAAFYPATERDFSIELGARAGYLPFSVDHNQSLLFGELGMLVGYRL